MGGLGLFSCGILHKPGIPIALSTRINPMFLLAGCDEGKPWFVFCCCPVSAGLPVSFRGRGRGGVSRALRAVPKGKKNDKSFLLLIIKWLLLFFLSVVFALLSRGMLPVHRCVKHDPAFPKVDI